MAHALNQLVRGSVSSYDWWPLDDENIREMAREDLRELFRGKDKVAVYNKDWTIYKELTEDDLDIDVDYNWAWGKDWKLREEIWKTFQDNIESECYWISDGISLEDRLKRYGLLYHGMSYRSPQYYNYENDELEIHLSEDELEDDCLPPRQISNPELIALVEKYIDEVRIPSCDGYHSFEPTDVNKVGRDDYAYLWAVLQKEWIYEDVQNAIEKSYEDIHEIIWGYANIRYLYRYEDEKWEKHCDKIYYDGKWLVVESQWY